MIKEQPKQLFYDAFDLEQIARTAFYKGVLVAGSAMLLAVGAIVLVFKLT